MNNSIEFRGRTFNIGDIVETNMDGDEVSNHIIIGMIGNINGCLVNILNNTNDGIPYPSAGLDKKKYKYLYCWEIDIDTSDNNCYIKLCQPRNCLLYWLIKKL